jgi:3-oxoacyl-[acyl-carrier-protein] synthase-1
VSVRPVALLKTGLVTPVGLTAPASCAAIRAKIANPRETRFMDSAGDWITGCAVPLDDAWLGRTKLAKMAALAIAECLEDVPRVEWSNIPLWLCLSESDRPGREENLDEQLYLDIARELGASFAPESAIVPNGRTGIGTALYQARKLIHEQDKSRVLIVAVDSLLHWPTLSAFDDAQRILTEDNSNGFMPGEAAGAVLIGKPTGGAELLCKGIGFGKEAATIESETPLRGDGIVQAIREALREGSCGFHELDLRISDLSGEQYYFKEAALAVARLMRKRREENIDIWHAAECTGETGAAAGAVALAVADAACRKSYAPGRRILIHASNDSGERAALLLEYGDQG